MLESYANTCILKMDNMSDQYGGLCVVTDDFWGIPTNMDQKCKSEK